MKSKWVLVRTGVMIGLFILVLLFFSLRLMQLQVVEGESLTAQIEQGWTDTQTIKAARGQIFDRNGRPLAVNAIRMVAFAVLFVGLSIVANLVLSTLGLVNYLPVVGPINALLGMLVGVLQGLLLVWILGLLLQGLLQLYPAGFWVFDPGVIDRTWVFRYIAHPGLLGGLG